MSEFPPCPKCKSPYTYNSGLLLTCAECGHEWAAEEAKVEEAASDEGLVVKDSNGVILQDGDTVSIIKDLPVKGFPKSIKALLPTRSSPSGRKCGHVLKRRCL